MKKICQVCLKDKEEYIPGICEECAKKMDSHIENMELED